MFYLGIEGAPGVGKTTLTKYLAEYYNVKPVLEIFEENPYLPLFHQDRVRYGFLSQIFFLMSRYEQQQTLFQIPRPIISDYTFSKDSIFARQNLNAEELSLYEKVNRAINVKILQPDFVIFLTADPDEIMRRIQKRGRSYEADMSEFVVQMQRAYHEFFLTYTSARVLHIDTTNLNIVDSLEARKEILERIFKFVSKNEK